MPHDITKLTRKEARFCVELVKTNNKYESYDLAGFEAVTQGAKAAAVSRLLKKDRIKEAITKLEEAIDKAALVTKERIIANLAEIAFDKSTAVGSPSKSDRIRATELLGKNKAMWIDKVEGSGQKLVITVSERAEEPPEQPEPKPEQPEQETCGGTFPGTPA